jgi:hypothetical protein
MVVKALKTGLKIVENWSKNAQSRFKNAQNTQNTSEMLKLKQFRGFHGFYNTSLLLENR